MQLTLISAGMKNKAWMVQQKQRLVTNLYDRGFFNIEELEKYRVEAKQHHKDKMVKSNQNASLTFRENS